MKRALAWYVGFFLFASCSSELRYAPGVLVVDAPVQEDLQQATIRRVGDYVIRPLARFHLSARVLGTERYRFDREAELAPVDLALGWGPMSDQAVLDQIDISQGGRFYHWSVKQFPIPRQAIIEHSANMHMVPANESVRTSLLNVRQGEIVRLKGYLVVATAPDGWLWRSSLSRKDTGNGACELIWVEEIVSYPGQTVLQDAS